MVPEHAQTDAIDHPLVARHQLRKGVFTPSLVEGFIACIRIRRHQIAICPSIHVASSVPETFVLP
jgi:hypothetical protein